MWHSWDITAAPNPSPALTTGISSTPLGPEEFWKWIPGVTGTDPQTLGRSSSLWGSLGTCGCSVSPYLGKAGPGGLQKDPFQPQLSHEGMSILPVHGPALSYPNLSTTMTSSNKIHLGEELSPCCLWQPEVMLIPGQAAPGAPREHPPKPGRENTDMASSEGEIMGGKCELRNS